MKIKGQYLSIAKEIPIRLKFINKTINPIKIRREPQIKSVCLFFINILSLIFYIAFIVGADSKFF